MDLKLLSDDFRPKVENLITLCKGRDVIMRPYCTVRTPIEQAKIWRQSRSREQIDRQIKFFKDNDAPYLADCLEKAGPQHGPWETDSLPGLSWHQWGEAVDCFWLVRGDADWTRPDRAPPGVLNGYRVYADAAKELQLTPLGSTRVQDWPHVQNFAHKVYDQYSLEEVDAEMRNRFDRPL